MKKITITIGITISVFVLTLLVTNQYVSTKSVEAADAQVMEKMDNLCYDFDNTLHMSKNAVYSFLAGNLFTNTKSNPDCFFVDDEKLKYIYEGLQEDFYDFLNANPSYEDVLFVIEKDKTEPLTKDSYYAPILTQEKDEIYNLADFYDLSKSENLKKCKNTLKSFWTLPSDMSGKLHKFVYFFVPICRNSDKSYIGAFCLSLNISTLDNKIEENLPYGVSDSKMIIVSDDSTIIASYPHDYKEFESYLSHKEKIRIKKAHSVDETSERKIINYQGNEYFLYERTLNNAPWKIVTGCTSNAVYAKANDINKVVLITSLIGMFLMLVSCIVIMLQIYRSHRKRIAAETELSMASKVQTALLRKIDYESADKSFHAYIKPAREAGGDLYDYAEVNGKLVFCIGDVSGKGMPAALFMTQVISLFRSAVKRSDDPAVIITSINDVLCENNPDMTFCTLFVGSIDGNTMKFANAGHNKPLLLHSASAPSFIPMVSNIAVGIMGGYPYQHEEYKLHKGDSILLYTDGVTEAKNKAHNQYGEARMINTLNTRSSNNPRHCTNLLLSSVRFFTNGAEQSDDITILTIQYNIQK